MPVEVHVPVLGESVVEATVGAWLKHEGEAVEAGEPLVQLETEKVNVDVAADQAGVLGKIAAQEGATVHPGDVLATIDAGTSTGKPARAGSSDAAEAPPAAAQAATDGAQQATEAAQQGAAQEGDGVERPHASPVARRMAEEHGLDLGSVEGTGTGGRVTREDVERHIASADHGQQPVSSTPARSAEPPAPAARPTPPTPAAEAEVQPAADGRPAEDQRQPPALTPDRAAGDRGETRIRMSRRRLTIASRLLEAQRTAAMLTTFNEADMSAIMAIRSRRREAFQQRHGVGLGFMSFFTRAVVGALRDFPNVNAELRGDEIVHKHYYDIGIAVGAEGGLVVPVVRDADRKSLAELEREIGQLADKARTNTLTLDDLRGGTFTITNGGVYGSLMSTPILSPPQVGILGMHRIQPRPVAVDGQVVIRPMMYLALTYDHRVVDGREAVQFLVRVKDLVEDPTALLLD